MPSYPGVGCLPAENDDLQNELTTRLAPFDATVTVEPYRRYLGRTPAEFAASIGVRFDPQNTTYGWEQVLNLYNVTRGPLRRLQIDEQGAYWISTENPRGR